MIKNNTSLSALLVAVFVAASAQAMGDAQCQSARKKLVVGTVATGLIGGVAAYKYPRLTLGVSAGMYTATLAAGYVVFAHKIRMLEEHIKALKINRAKPEEIAAAEKELEETKHFAHCTLAGAIPSTCILLGVIANELVGK